MNKFCINIGDWSGDGHCECDRYIFETDKNVEELRHAYWKSVKETGLNFSHSLYIGGTYSYGLDWDGAPQDTTICVNYDQKYIKEIHTEILKSYGLIVSRKISTKNFATLILNFIKLNVPDFNWGIIECVEERTDNRTKIEIDNLNGYWCDVLNVQFGYGLFL